MVEMARLDEHRELGNNIETGNVNKHLRIVGIEPTHRQGGLHYRDGTRIRH